MVNNIAKDVHLCGYEKGKNDNSDIMKNIIKENKSLRKEVKNLSRIIENQREDKLLRCRNISRLNEKIYFLEDTLDRRTCFEIIGAISFTIFALVVTRFCRKKNINYNFYLFCGWVYRMGW